MGGRILLCPLRGITTRVFVPVPKWIVVENPGARGELAVSEKCAVESVKNVAGVRTAHQDGHSGVPVPMVGVPFQLGEGTSSRIDMGQLGRREGSEPLAGRADPQSCAGRFQPHRVAGSAGKPEPPPRADDAVEHHIQALVQTARVEGTSGMELNEVDRPPGIQGRLSGQQRIVWIVASPLPRVAIKIVQRIPDAIGTHLNTRAAPGGAARRP